MGSGEKTRPKISKVDVGTASERYQIELGEDCTIYVWPDEEGMSGLVHIMDERKTPNTTVEFCVLGKTFNEESELLTDDYILKDEAYEFVCEDPPEREYED